MRHVPDALQARLDSGVTTLCICWIVRRRDDVVLGFTDHDVDLTIEGVTCKAGSGLSASEMTSRSNLAIDGGEISGALSDESLTESDLAAGLFDAAAIEAWLVDWSDPSLRMLGLKGTIGEVKREGDAFSAEVRGLTDALARESGRLYTLNCGADLGDHRCKVDLASASFRGTGIVIAVESVGSFTVSGLAGFGDGFFTAGRLQWSTGANAGRAMDVKLHQSSGGVVRITLWQAMAEAIANGDAFQVTAGCDKRFSTCRERFGNAVNFRGFPHIPGNDFLVRHATSGEPGHSGKSFES